MKKLRKMARRHRANGWLPENDYLALALDAYLRGDTAVALYHLDRADEARWNDVPF